MRVRSNCGPESGAAVVHYKRDGLALLLLDESSRASVVGCGTKLTENVGPLRVASAPYSSLMHTGLACNMRTPLPSQAEPTTSVAHKANGGSGGEGAAHCAAVPAAGRVGSSSTPTRRAAPPSTRPARRRPDTPGHIESCRARRSLRRNDAAKNPQTVRSACADPTPASRATPAGYAMDRVHPYRPTGEVSRAQRMLYTRCGSRSRSRSPLACGASLA